MLGYFSDYTVRTPHQTKKKNASYIRKENGATKTRGLSVICWIIVCKTTVGPANIYSSVYWVSFFFHDWSFIVCNIKESVTIAKKDQAEICVLYRVNKNFISLLCEQEVKFRSAVAEQQSEQNRSLTYELYKQ